MDVKSNGSSNHIPSLLKTKEAKNKYLWPVGVMSGILTKKSQVQGPVHESETMDFPQNENTSLFPESIFYPSLAIIPF